MSVTPYGFVSPRVDYKTPPATDRIVPRRTVSLVPEDSMMWRGMPRVPDIGISAEFLIDLQGIVYTDRPSLQDANPDSWASFVADDEFYDPITGIWIPVHDSSPVRYTLVGAAGASPALSTISYRSKRELFSNESLSFDDTVTMSSNFNEGFDDSTNFVLGMALTPVSSAGADPLVDFGDGNRIDIVPTGLRATLDGLSWNVKIPHGPLLLAPMYLILQLIPPKATLTAGFSPNLAYQGSSRITRDTTKFAFTLASPMELFALDIWGDEAPSTVDIIARYSACLGSDDSTIGAFV